MAEKKLKIRYDKEGDIAAWDRRAEAGAAPARAGTLSPPEIWDGLAISKQGAMDLIRPLVKAELG